MQSTTSSRLFSALNKSVVVMANGQSADIAAARVMQKLSEVSGVEDFDYFGYGGDHMKQAGLNNSEIDANQIQDKTFYTYRKTRLHDKSTFQRFNPFNLINKHYTRATDDVFTQLED